MNLLTDDLLRIQTTSSETRMNLPGLMAALGRNDVVSYPGLQRHQEDAFHVFLCYLAGAVLVRGNVEDPVQSEDFWRRGLRALAGRDDDLAWSLVVDDVSKPAFMQPPLPNEDRANLKLKARTPDELDLLPTAKNHDVKTARAARATIDEWIYALISLQTMSGYFGQGNQGISRMNSGFGNRPIVELLHSQQPGQRWQDAVVRLFEHRKQVLRKPWGYDPRGRVLVWIDPWDGITSLSLAKLDPFYIEICRRIRLRNNIHRTGLHVVAVPAKAPRIYAKDFNGNVGDAWLPIGLGKGKTKVRMELAALTVGPAGITPELLRALIFENGYELTPLQRPVAGADSGPVWLAVSVLVRGQGTTDGFHSKKIMIPIKIRKSLFGPVHVQRDRLASLSRTGIEYAGIMLRSVLKPAVFAYLEGAPDKIQFDRDSTNAWWQWAAQRFQDLWCDDYFPWLWRATDSVDRAAHEWAIVLRNHALNVLHDVMAAMPAHCGRWYQVRVRTERVFWGALYGKKNFPFLKEDPHDTLVSASSIE